MIIDILREIDMKCNKSTCTAKKKKKTKAQIFYLKKKKPCCKECAEHKPCKGTKKKK